MILSTHFVTGAAVAGYTESPISMVGIAILSHFILDLIPHWEYVNLPRELKKKIFHLLFDLIAGPITVFVLIMLLYGFDVGRLSWFFLGGIAGMLPDSLTLFHIKYPHSKSLRTFYTFHHWIHMLVGNGKKINWKIGFTFQIVLDLTAVILIALSKA